MGYEAFVDEHCSEMRELQRWLEIDRFDRRAANRQLAELATASAGQTV